MYKGKVVMVTGASNGIGNAIYYYICVLKIDTGKLWRTKIKMD